MAARAMKMERTGSADTRITDEKKMARDRARNVHFTAIVRLPFRRGDFVDPGPVDWDTNKDDQLWSIISSEARSREINWEELADRFEVSLPFMLQQAAWLYERHLSHVRAQMKKGRQPAAGGVAMRRGGSAGGPSRGTTALSVRSNESPVLKNDLSAPPTPRGSGFPPLSRNPSTNTVTQSRPHGTPNSPRPAHAQLNQTRPLRPTPENPTATPPIAGGRHSASPAASPRAPSPSSSSTSSNGPPPPARHAFKRPPAFAAHRSALGRSFARSKPFSPNPDTSTSASSTEDDDEDNTDPDSAPSLPFANPNPDPSATLRSGLPTASTSASASASTSAEPHTASPASRSRANTATARHPGPMSTASSALAPTDSSASSASETPPVRSAAPSAPAGRATPLASRGPASPSRRLRGRGAVGSPRRAGAGSEGGTSMGSSFSDLDDPSVTQSALEEALLNNYQQQQASGGVASKMSSLSQALRSKYL